MKKQLLAIFPLLFHMGCVERVELDNQHDYPRRLVFEGEISNDAPPYYFRLFKSAPLNVNYFEGIGDALLVLSDDQGGKDTLKPLIKKIYTHGNYESCSYYYINAKGDSIYLNSKIRTFDEPENVFDGYYASHHLIGTPGNKYTLDIFYEGHRYTACEKMKEIPEVTHFEIRYVTHEKEGKQLSPFINFKNPSSQENYYIFSFKRSSLDEMTCGMSIMNWPYAITNGFDLPENVVDFQVNSGESSKGFPNNMWHFYNETDPAIIRVGSISKFYFNFMSGQIDQLRADGGAYMPSPVSLKGNFGAEILGYFRVISFCEKTTFYKK